VYEQFGLWSNGRRVFTTPDRSLLTRLWDVSESLLLFLAIIGDWHLFDKALRWIHLRYSKLVVAAAASLRASTISSSRFGVLSRA
jgi:hypothetical protein